MEGSHFQSVPVLNSLQNSNRQLPSPSEDPESNESHTSLPFGAELPLNCTDVSECAFVDWTANPTNGKGGAQYVQYSALSRTSVQFRGNSAWQGSDVYFSSGCGTPAELMERVSDCRTDNDATSLYFEQTVQTGIIKQFGTATTITSLEITPSANTR
ncbi:hypothetical protein BLNAU_11157 [Blattamonas nauphoetae]|uniref:Uncharacterized protein n=1 Tax=Blattamonas nauphoetae TaxID=2049346 RepID=A0ABQ9XR04_9EUKA|nr:hypothetical protein BLNAU_11157 [Blattamonas nauphoetae]